MGKCCKKSKAAAKPEAKPANIQKDPGNLAKKTPAASGSSIMGITMKEAVFATGILVFLPVVLDRVAPNALRSIKNAFELASKG
jgi:hypothetical protein